MSTLSLIVAKWGQAQPTLDEELRDAEGRLSDHLANPPKGIVDVAVHAKYLTDKAALEIQVQAAKNALAVAAAELAKAKAGEAKEDAAKMHAEMRREALAEKKRVTAVLAKLEAIVPDLQAIAGHVERVAAYNKISGREPIVDAEALVRMVPGRTIPAEIREITGWWVGDSDDQPSFYRLDAKGEQTPANPGPWTKQKRRIQTAPESYEPARLPERLATALRFVDLSGKLIWGKDRRL